MIIKVLKSKANNVKVDRATINDDGSIQLPIDLMDSMCIIENEEVIVINQATGRQQLLFVEKSITNEVVVPIFVCQANSSLLTIISRATATFDEPIKDPIIISY